MHWLRHGIDIEYMKSELPQKFAYSNGGKYIEFTYMIHPFKSTQNYAIPSTWS